MQTKTQERNLIMNRKNINPNPSQPVNCLPSVKLPSALAELSEEEIGGSVTSSLNAPCCIPTVYEDSDE